MIISGFVMSCFSFSPVSNSDGVDIHAEEERKEKNSKVLQTI